MGVCWMRIKDVPRISYKQLVLLRVYMGMKSYLVMRGLFHKPWHKDSYKKSTRMQLKVRLTCLKFNKHTSLGIANSVPPLFLYNHHASLWSNGWHAVTGAGWRRRHGRSGGGGRSGGTSLKKKICIWKSHSVAFYKKCIPFWHFINHTFFFLIKCKEREHAYHQWRGIDWILLTYVLKLMHCPKCIVQGSAMWVWWTCENLFLTIDQQHLCFCFLGF